MLRLEFPDHFQPCRNNAMLMVFVDFNQNNHIPAIEASPR